MTRSQATQNTTLAASLILTFRNLPLETQLSNGLHVTPDSEQRHRAR